MASPFRSVPLPRRDPRDPEPLFDPNRFGLKNPFDSYMKSLPLSEQRAIGIERLKRAMFKEIGVDIDTKGPFDDSRTAEDEWRMEMVRGQATKKGLKLREQRIEKEMRKPFNKEVDEGENNVDWRNRDMQPIADKLTASPASTLGRTGDIDLRSLGEGMHPQNDNIEVDPPKGEDNNTIDPEDIQTRSELIQEATKRDPIELDLTSDLAQLREQKLLKLAGDVVNFPSVMDQMQRSASKVSRNPQLNEQNQTRETLSRALGRENVIPFVDPRRTQK